MWTDLAVLRYDVKYCEEHTDYSAVAWPVLGWFKVHNGQLNFYMITIEETTNSGICFFLLTQGLIGRLAMEGHMDGWAFQRAGGLRAKALDYKQDIFSRLETIQSSTNLIDNNWDIWTEFGVQRSGSLLFTTHCTDRGMP